MVSYPQPHLPSSALGHATAVVPPQRQPLDQEKARLSQFATCIQQTCNQVVKEALDERNQEAERLLGQMATFEAEYLAAEESIQQQSAGLLKKLYAAIQSDVYVYDPVIDEILQRDEPVASEDYARRLLGQLSTPNLIGSAPNPRGSYPEEIKTVPLKPKSKTGKAKKKASSGAQSPLAGEDHRNLIQASNTPVSVLRGSSESQRLQKSSDNLIKSAKHFESKKNYRKALDFFYRAVEKEKSIASPRVPTLMDIYTRIAACYRALMCFNEALEALSSLLDYARRARNDHQQRVAYQMYRSVYQQMERLDKAMEASDELLRLDLKIASQDPYKVAYFWLEHARFAKKCKAVEAAIKAYQQCISTVDQVRSPTQKQIEQRRTAENELNALLRA